MCLCFQTIRDNVDFHRGKKKIAKGELIAKQDTTTTKLNEGQLADLHAVHELKEKYAATTKVKDKDKSLKMVRGRYAQLYAYQSERSYHGEIFYTCFGKTVSGSVGSLSIFFFPL